MRSPLAAAFLAIFALSACGKARQSASESASAETRCVRCHGGLENQTGAPPNALRGASDTTAMAVGAHSAHVQAGDLAGAFACTACHPDPRSGATHLDGKVELALEGFAHDGLPGNGETPAFDETSGTCSSVYCHGAFRNGNGGNAPVWNRVGQGQAACGSCHGAPPPPPHPGSTDCGRCHEGYTATSVNVATHVNGKLDIVGLSCTSCHGDPSRARNAAAPPLGTHGETSTSDRAVGAHQAHLDGAALGTPIACEQCHTVPTSLAHASGRVDLTFGALATAGGALAASFDGATCTTYCHGATLRAGGSNTAPRWTGGAGEAACGSCHAVPPPSPHPAVSNDLTLCAACHPQTMTGAGALIPASAGGKHLDGVVESSGHDASWMDSSSPGFHAYSANADLAACTTCHGAQLDGGTVQVACGKCHNFYPKVVDDWRQNCVMCHGGTDNATGAPPRTTWGRSGDAVRVGAHTTHVSGSDIAPPFDCSVCHVKPDRALSPGHVDGPTATVTFSGLATNGEVVPPVWDRASATCATTYCHGNFRGGNVGNAPVWTIVGQGEASCGSCHGLPPPAPHPSVSSDLTQCATCHPQTMTSSGAIIPPSAGGKHLDGFRDGGHQPSWMDQSSSGFHAFAADNDLASCKGCHGAELDGGSVQLACAQCHDLSLPQGVASWRQNCVMCHGGTDNLTGAPPRTIWGRGSDAVRIGAHTKHVTGSNMAPAFDCSVCHVKPTDALSAGHVDGQTATVVFSGEAVATSAATPTWDRTSATCSSTYCHGAALGGGTNTSPRWTGGEGEAACGSCHGLPPGPPHPTVSIDPLAPLSKCYGCHAETMSSSGALIPPATGGKHLDGQTQPDPKTLACNSCHGLPPDDGGFNGHLFHVSTQNVDCVTCHKGYSRSVADPAYHWNGTRDAWISHWVPNPDPVDAPPTLDACNAPSIGFVKMPQNPTPPVWDPTLCASCHGAQNYLFERCCGDGGPSPDWCSSWY